MADGRITIDTGLDTSGFDKGSEGMKRALESMLATANRVGKDAGAGVSRVADKMRAFVRSAQEIDDTSGRLTFAQYLSSAQSDVTKLMQSMTTLGKETSKLGTEKGVAQFNQDLEAAAQAIFTMRDRLVQLNGVKVETSEYVEVQKMAQQMAAEIDHLQKTADKLEAKGVNKYSQEWTDLQDQIWRAQESYESFKYEMEHAEELGLIRVSSDSDFAPKLRELGDMYQGLVKTYMQFQGQMVESADALDAAKAEAAAEEAATRAEERHRAAADALSGSLSALGSVLTTAVGAALHGVVVGIQSALSALRSFGQWALAAPFQALQMGARGLATAFSAIKSGAEHITSGIGRVAGVVRTAASSFASLLSKLHIFNRQGGKVGNVATDIVKKLNSVKRMLVSRVKRMFISAIFKDMSAALQAIASKSKEFNAAMSGMQNAAKGLTTNLAVTFSNILNIIGPIITQIINWVTTLITYINALFAMLTGKSTILAAKKSTDAYGKSAGGAAKQAKELKKQVMGFDEINNLTDQDDSGGGGGGGGGAPELVEQSIDSLLPENVKAYFEKLKEAILSENWEEVGGLVADALNAGMKKIDDAILAIQGKVSEWATIAARILNGVVARFNFPLLGKTIGDGLNTIIYAVNSFLETFNSIALGAGLGDAVNSMFATIDWTALGQFFANRINLFIDVIKGFLSRFEATTAGTDLGEMVNSMFAKIHWENLGSDIRDGVNKLTEALDSFITELEKNKENNQNRISAVIRNVILGIDWTGAIRVFSNGVQFLIDWAAMLFANFPWVEWATELTNGINSLISNPDGEGSSWKVICTNIGAGIDAVVKAFAAITDPKTGINFDQLGTNIGEGLRTIAAKINFGEVLMTIWHGFVGVAAMFTAGVAEAIKDLPIKAVQIAKAINTLVTENSFSVVVGNVVSGINSLIAAFKAIIVGDPSQGIEPINFNDIGTEIANHINTLISETDFETAIATAAHGIVKIQQAFFKAVAHIDWVGLATKLASGINKFLHDPSIKWDEWGKDLGESLKKIIEGMTAFLDEVNWTQLGANIGIALANIKWGDIAKGMWTLFKEALKDAFNLVEGITNALQGHVTPPSDEEFVNLMNPIGDAMWNALQKTIEHKFTNFGVATFTRGFESVGKAGAQSLMTSLEAEISASQLKGMPQMWTPDQMRQAALLFSLGYANEIESQLGAGNYIGEALNRVAGAQDIGAAQRAFEQFGLDVSAAFINSLNGQGEADIMAAIQMLLMGINDQTITNIGVTGLAENLRYYIEECGLTLEDAAIMLAQNVGESIGSTIPEAIDESLQQGKENIQNTAEDLSKAADTSATQATAGENATATGETITSSMTDSMDKGEPELSAEAEALLAAVNMAIAAGTPAATATMETAADAVIKAAEDKLNASAGETIANTFVGGIVNGIQSSQGNMYDQMVPVGQYIDAGIAHGIYSYTSLVTTAAQNAAIAAYNAACATLNIGSPSKVFADVGKFTMLGWAQGEEDNEKAVLDAITNTAEAMQEEAKDTTIDVGMDPMINGLDVALDRLNEIAQVFAGIGDMLTHVGDLPIPSIATGNVIPYRTRVSDTVAVEDDGISPAERLTATSMERGVYNAIREALRDTGDRPINIYLDGKQLSGAIARMNRQTARATGV